MQKKKRKDKSVSRSSDYTEEEAERILTESFAEQARIWSLSHSEIIEILYAMLTPNQRGELSLKMHVRIEHIIKEGKGKEYE
jgi:hypothetical protein